MKNRFVSCLLAVALLASGCANPEPEPVSGTDFVLNTVATIRIDALSGRTGKETFPQQAQVRIDECFRLCRDYEEIFSRTLETSELYQVNSRENSIVLADGSSTCTVSDDLADLIALGLEYSARSNGAFDITVAPLSDLWNFSAEQPQVPDSADIRLALEAVDYRNVFLDGNELTITNPDTRIDLGAIAKGYIADRLADYLRENGVTSAIINLGGNVLCVGSRPSGKPFSVGLQDPFSDRGDTLLTLQAENLSVVSSGIYERCFTEDGILYHHILNPDTGYPYDNGLASVTILSASSALADALSTTCFALGLDDGIALLDSMPDACGIFITTDGSIHYSEGADAYLTR